MIFQPVLVVSESVWKSIWTMLVRLVIFGGRTDPHFSFIKIVPSLSLILR